ncbi:MAG: hypothetical protein EOO50_05290 [Flavobacterium sp.]|uniref:hypothetical protein n=1 Tax=Flavobacterium sp. TaxID=239 RepID=UPI00121EEB7B|nr:hypothetical protein [Flavobacterium sp.]RZJ67698.1 MAG: hypothetical protein EOO50_05290 [Flavobacterium sp.]
MALCTYRVSKSIAVDCEPQNQPKTGLEEKAILITRKDIDLATLTQSGATVTNLNLKSGTTAVSLEWVKQLSTSSSEFAANETGLDGFTHRFAGRVHYSDAHSSEFLNELRMAEVVMVVETKYKGTNNASAFKIYGLEQGLRMTAMNHSTAENGGGATFEIASQEGYSESFPWLVWNEGSYAVNKTKFDGLF